MKGKDINVEIEAEKKKLEKLVEEAWKKGIPLSKDRAVLAQSRKIDKLVLKILKGEK